MEVDLETNKNKLKPWSIFKDKAIEKKYGKSSREEFYDIIEALNAAPTFQDFIPFGRRVFDLHKLQGNRKHQWAMKINNQIRICIRIPDLHPDLSNSGECTIAIVEDIGDYHK